MISSSKRTDLASCWLVNHIHVTPLFQCSIGYLLEFYCHYIQRLTVCELDDLCLDSGGQLLFSAQMTIVLHLMNIFCGTKFDTMHIRLCEVLRQRYHSWTTTESSTFCVVIIWKHVSLSL